MEKLLSSPALAAAWPACDVLVNNAGITGFEETMRPHDPEHASLADWRAVHAVNLDGTFLGYPGWPQSCRARRRSPPHPIPVVDPGVDRDRDPKESHGDEHPAERIEIRHERQDGGLGLGQDALCDFDPRRA